MRDKFLKKLYDQKFKEKMKMLEQRQQNRDRIYRVSRNRTLFNNKVLARSWNKLKYERIKEFRSISDKKHEQASKRYKEIENRIIFRHNLNKGCLHKENLKNKPPLHKNAKVKIVKVTSQNHEE